MTRSASRSICLGNVRIRAGEDRIHLRKYSFTPALFLIWKNTFRINNGGSWTHIQALLKPDPTLFLPLQSLAPAALAYQSFQFTINSSSSSSSPKFEPFPESQLHFLSMNLLRQWWARAAEARHAAVATAKFVGLLHLTDKYLGSCTLTHGPSMLPTFNSSGDVVVAEHVSHRLGRLAPGDVIVVQSPDNPKTIVVKRLLGLEGDKVSFFDPYRIRQHGTVVVPKGHVWIQGDNTYDSHDSRSYGPVPYSLIQGRVFFRVWPRDGFGFSY